ncbi:MAG: helix-turn-helix domain-containing protein, partial [Victivallales bacterium]
QYRFSKEYNGNTNLKRFIEEILLELAEKHLQYPSMTLTEIAGEMNFSSIYVFSRFYKRKTGVSPLKKRRKIS